ncbi:MAG TPA: type II toxin-antitoxin system VapC family toxin [Bradyrhizobium sp.]
MTESSTSVIYLDTNVFIRAVEGTDETAARAKRLIQTLRGQRPGVAATGEIAFAEVLASPKRSDALPLHIKRRAYLDLLVWSAVIALIPVSRDILIETAGLSTVARFKLPDAIHLVSAKRRGYRFFVSTDKDFDKLPQGMERIDPDEHGLSRLIEELS